jgi:hypothetical protein
LLVTNSACAISRFVMPAAAWAATRASLGVRGIDAGTRPPPRSRTERAQLLLGPCGGALRAAPVGEVECDPECFASRSALPGSPEGYAERALRPRQLDR